VPASALPPSSAPSPAARLHLDGGFHFEQAGLSAKAIAAYNAALSAGATPAERAEAHLRLARVYRSLSDWTAAVREAREAVRLADQAGADDLAAEAMNVEVGVHALRGDFERGEALALDALARARAPRVRGILLQNRGTMAAQQGDFAAADRLFAESVAAFRESGYELGLAIALNNSAAAARDAGDPARSVDLARQAAELARKLSALDVLVVAVQNQAHSLVLLGRPDEAELLVGEALGHFASTHNVLRQAECLEIMGTLNALRPEFRDTAVRCYELALALAERIGARVLADRLRGRLAAIGTVGGAAAAGGERPVPPT
jgi:tetratricopeptide (TPR) repeat protein